MNAIQKYTAGAVVMGMSPTGLYAVRELGRAGVPVLGVSASAQCANASKYLTHPLKSIIEPNEEARLGKLCAAFKDAIEKAVLIPTSDQDIAFIARHKDILAKFFVFQSSYANGLAETILEKSTFYALCEKHGIAYPSFWEGARENLTGLISHIKFPVVLKPSKIHAVKAEMAGVKAWALRDEKEYLNRIAILPHGDTDWLVQEIVPGPESDISLYCAWIGKDQKPVQSFTAKKLRQFPPGFGSASLVAGHDEPQVKALSEKLMTAIGYEGIAATEFKYDRRDDMYKIIESNPRPSLWFSASTASGRTAALAAYCALAGYEMPKAQDIVQGVQWRYGLKDLYSKLFYLRNRKFILPPPDLRAAGKPSRKIYAVFAWDDPRPAIGEVSANLRKLWQRILRKRGRADKGKS